MIRIVLLAGLLGCGPKPGAAAPEDPKVTAQPALPDVRFADLDLEQRAEFMKQKVVPAMTPLFRDHDPKKYSDVGCKTCHGDDAETGDFDMPNESLPVLDFADMSKFRPADIEWMKTKIKPAMAKILGEPEHTQENPSGFGCLNCHTAAGT